LFARALACAARHMGVSPMSAAVSYVPRVCRLTNAEAVKGAIDDARVASIFIYSFVAALTR